MRKIRLSIDNSQSLQYRKKKIHLTRKRTDKKKQTTQNPLLNESTRVDLSTKFFISLNSEIKFAF